MRNISVRQLFGRADKKSETVGPAGRQKFRRFGDLCRKSRFLYGFLTSKKKFTVFQMVDRELSCKRPIPKTLEYPSGQIQIWAILTLARRVKFHTPQRILTLTRR